MIASCFCPTFRFRLMIGMNLLAPNIRQNRMFLSTVQSNISPRYEATDMNIYRSALSACVIMGLPNVNDYIHKHRERLMEEKRQKLLALEVHRSQHQQQQEQMQQNRENLLNDEIISIPSPSPSPRNSDFSNESQRNWRWKRRRYFMGVETLIRQSTVSYVYGGWSKLTASLQID